MTNEQNSTNSDRRLETRPELAKRYGVSARTVANWQQQRLIPFLKIQRTIRFDPIQVDAAIARNHRIAARGEAAS